MNLGKESLMFFFAALAVSLLDSPSLAYIVASFSEVCTRDEDLSGEWDSQEESHVFQQKAMLLEGRGHRSAALLAARMSDPPCSLIVQAPRDTHVIAVSLYNFPRGIHCPLAVWFHDGENKEDPWSLYLCQGDNRGLIALEIYPNRVTLRWNSDLSLRGKGNDSNEMKSVAPEKPMEIVVTAVARGSVCEDESRVLCWKVMKESFCVSEELVCDGYNNCPRPGNDESKTMCQNQHEENEANNNNDTLQETQSGDEDEAGDTSSSTSAGSKPWEILADHFRRIMAVKTGSSNNTISNVVVWSLKKKNGSRGGNKHNGNRNTMDVLTSDGKEINEGGGNEEGAGGGFLPSRLGPWTFVLLCMLSCGSILLLCGLWECCCRSGGASAFSPPVSPRGSIATTSFSANGHQSSAARRTTTTVVIIRSSSDSPPPPDYDELEQPPDYKELFPSKKTKSTVSARERMDST